jgi:hypothetical protein
MSVDDHAGRRGLQASSAMPPRSRGVTGDRTLADAVIRCAAGPEFWSTLETRTSGLQGQSSLLVCKSAVQHLRRLDKRRILVGEKAMPRKNPLDVNTVNLDDTADRKAFYDALIADGAPIVREERMQAFQAGLIDERGYVIDRKRIESVSAELSVEQ